MVLYFHRFSPVTTLKRNYKRGGKLKNYHNPKEAVQVLTPENLQFLRSLGFKIVQNGTA